MKFKDHAFVDEKVSLDGNQFYGCTFTGCSLVYAGGAHPFMDHCDVVDSTFLAIEEAGHVMQFWKGLYASGMREPVESIFDWVRGGPAVKPAIER